MTGARPEESTRRAEIGETAEREASAYLAFILHIITTAVRTTIRPRTGVALSAGPPALVPSK